MAAKNNPFSSDSRASTCMIALRRLIIMKKPIRNKETATARVLCPRLAAAEAATSARWKDSATT